MRCLVKGEVMPGRAGDFWAMGAAFLSWSACGAPAGRCSSRPKQAVIPWGCSRAEPGDQVIQAVQPCWRITLICWGSVAVGVSSPIGQVRRSEGCVPAICNVLPPGTFFSSRHVHPTEARKAGRTDASVLSSRSWFGNRAYADGF